MIEINNVVKNYFLGKAVVKALKGVTLDIQDSSFIAITGASGSGKTSLLNIIGAIFISAVFCCPHNKP